MPLFNQDKFARLAELEARVQKAIEEAGGAGLDWAEDELGGLAGSAGFDLVGARILDAATLDALLGVGTEDADPGRLWLAAESLFLDGLVARAEGRVAEAADRFEKARRLYAGLGPDAHLPREAASSAEDGEHIGCTPAPR